MNTGTDTCETVLINSANGPVRINKSDFVEGEHKLHRMNAEEKAEAARPAVTANTIPQLAPGLELPPAPSAPNMGEGGAAAPQTPSPDQKLVTKEGKKFFVVDVTGTKVTGVEGIDEKGYATEKEAWDAVLATNK